MLPVNVKVSTPYGAKCCGSSGRPHYWTGHIHKGPDFAAATGTPIVAAWSGVVIDVSWGPAFGLHVVIDTDTLPDGTAGLWVGYAHMSKKAVKVGDRVKVGQKIGEVGSTGNVTGSHCHFEVQASKFWSPKGYRDPSKWLNAKVFTYLQEKKVYQSTMVYAKQDSDSVRNVQTALNEKSNAGLAVTGDYFDSTRAAVVKWQQKQGWSGADADGIPGPSTVASLGLVWVDDVPDSPPPTKPAAGHVEPLRLALSDLSNIEYVAGWDNSSYAGNGTFSPEYVMMHHTAGTNSLSTLRPGGTYPNNFGANFLVRRDGRILVLTAFKAYHAGVGSYPGVPKDKMNDFSWGIEIESLGTKQDMPQVQIDQAAALAAELIKMMDSPIEYIINHKTYSSSGKIDTLYSDEFWQNAAAGEPEYLTRPEADKLYLPIDFKLPPLSSTQVVKDWDDYSGKPANYITITNEWTKIDARIEANKVGGEEFRMLYARVVFVGEGFDYWTGTGFAKVECQWVRDGGTPGDTSDDDPTAMDERHYERGTKSVPFQMIHFESGEIGNGGSWFMRVHGGANKARITTRYTKGWALEVK